MEMTVVLLLILLASCANRAINLQKSSYELKDLVKITVSSVKEHRDDTTLKFLGYSLGEEIVGVKQEDISCSKGQTKSSGINIVTQDSEIILFAKNAFTEFTVECQLPDVDKIKGHYKFAFKNLYSTEKGKLDKVIASDVYLELK